MSRYIKSTSDTRDLSKSLKDLQTEFSTHRNVVEKNNKELSKVNAQIELSTEKEIKLLHEKISKLQTQTQWVKNDEPALKVDSQHMLKKLDIL
jgi:predicted  nucleic acid-binding Zn-ribbon protein